MVCVQPSQWNTRGQLQPAVPQSRPRQPTVGSCNMSAAFSPDAWLLSRINVFVFLFCFFAKSSLRNGARNGRKLQSTTGRYGASRSSRSSAGARRRSPASIRRVQLTALHGDAQRQAATAPSRDLPVRVELRCFHRRARERDPHSFKHAGVVHDDCRGTNVWIFVRFQKYVSCHRRCANKSE